MHESFAVPADARRRLFGLALLVAGSVAFSFGFACAMPFAALGAVAVCTLPRRDAWVAVGAAWVVNQAVGFLCLGYPRTMNTVAWGVAIGLAALLSTLAAGATRQRLSGAPSWAVAALAFGAAFLTLEAAFFVSSLVLGGTEDFTFAIQARVFAIEAAALVGLFALYRLGVFLGISSSSSLADRSGLPEAPPVANG